MTYLISPAQMPVVPVGPKGSFARVFHGDGHAVSSVSLMLSEVQPGEGPALHRHDYDELFVVGEGSGTFLIGETEVEAARGDVVLVPAGIPHAFHNTGEGMLRLTAIHLASRVSIEWIDPSSSEDPGARKSR